MVGFKFELDGLEETIANMDLSTRKVNDGSNEALSQGGEVLRNTIEHNTPVATGLAKSRVVKSSVRTATASAYKSILVGYGADVAWRMWFLEEGTYSKGAPKGIAPRKIVAGSIEQSGSASAAVIASYMSDVIGSL